MPKLIMTNKQTGFTLLEVMIAMVIFSIGLLGLAGIQGVSLQSNNSAYMRTVAMQYSYNMADLIRTATDGDGVVDATYTDGFSSSLPGTEPTDCIVNDATTNCSLSDMADFDIYHWKKSLADKDRGLPSGRGTLTKNGDIFEIKIMWDENRTGTTAETCGTSDLKCYIIHIQT